MTRTEPSASFVDRAQRITTVDLDWWLSMIPTLDWVFAVTYSEGAPHEYICDRTEGMTHNDFVRAARVIRTFGAPQKFYKSTRIYLVHEGWKYWDMEGGAISACNLINRGRANHMYGVQNAPLTRSKHSTAYDEVATFWDDRHAATDEERDGIIALTGDFGDFTKKRVLDIGCGTGLALDLRITESVRYTGIDPSGPMLNELVRKHPLVASVHPTTLTRARDRRVLGGTKFDLVLALGGSASYLSRADLAALPASARGTYLLTAYAEGEAPVLDNASNAELQVARERLRAFAADGGGRMERVGRFEVAVLAGESRRRWSTAWTGGAVAPARIGHSDLSSTGDPGPGKDEQEVTAGEL